MELNNNSNEFLFGFQSESVRAYMTCIIYCWNSSSKYVQHMFIFACVCIFTLRINWCYLEYNGLDWSFYQIHIWRVSFFKLKYIALVCQVTRKAVFLDYSSMILEIIVFFSCYELFYNVVLKIDEVNILKVFVCNIELSMKNTLYTCTSMWFTHIRIWLEPMFYVFLRLQTPQHVLNCDNVGTSCPPCRSFFIIWKIAYMYIYHKKCMFNNKYRHHQFHLLASNAYTKSE